MKHIQAMINCDLPGHRQIEYDIGAGYVAVQISGWRPFKEYLSALSGVIPGGWDLLYEELNDRVYVANGTGTIKLRFESESMADTLGSSSTVTATVTAGSTIGTSPKGITPIQSLHISDPVSGNTPSLRTFRHGRSHATAYGAAKNYDVSIRLDPANISRL